MKGKLIAGMVTATACAAFGIDLPEGLTGFNMVTPVEKCELRPGVTYFKTHFAAARKDEDVSKGLFGKDGPCAIYWLVMEWDKCVGNVSLDIAYNENGRREMPTTWAKQRDKYVLQSKPSNQRPERRVHHSIQLIDIAK